MLNRDKPAETKSILWNVVEQHLEEGAFAYRRWAFSLNSPDETLQTVRHRHEERLRAHVDGLVIGGEAVAQRTLEPELSSPLEPDVERSAVAALALLEQGAFAPVRAALDCELPAVRLGAEHALAIAGTAQVEPWLRAQLHSGTFSIHPAERLRIASRRRIPVSNLLEPLQSADDAQVAAAAAAARQSEFSLLGPAIEYLLWSSNVSVRDAALETALIFGAMTAFQRCLALVSSDAVAPATPMLLIALLGDTRHHERLLSHLSSPKHRYAAIRALGFAGYAGYVSHLLPHAASEDAKTAKLAGEAIFNISGLAAPSRSAPPSEAQSLPPLEQDDLNADLIPGQEDALPVPDAVALAEMWQLAAPNLRSTDRLLQGQPWSVPRALERLSSTTMRQRHPIALWLRIRSGGALDLETRALTIHQLSALRQLQVVATDAHLVRNFSGV